ncbi:hypothetical protein Droror1_Dr00012445 [Drosera rotundifolia]
MYCSSSLLVFSSQSIAGVAVGRLRGQRRRCGCAGDRPGWRDAAGEFSGSSALLLLLLVGGSAGKIQGKRRWAIGERLRLATVVVRLGNGSNSFLAAQILMWILLWASLDFWREESLMSLTNPLRVKVSAAVRVYPRAKRKILCGNCNGAGFVGGFMSTGET